MTRKRTSENELMATAASSAAPVRRKTPARPRAKRAVATPESAIAPTTPSEIAEPQTAVLAVATTYEPSHEEIAALAYLYWEARGCQGGSPEEDWLRAEQQLRSGTAIAVAATA